MIIDAHTHYAGFWRRLGAFFIDMVLISLLLSLLASIFGKVSLSSSYDISQLIELQRMQYFINPFLFILTVYLWVKFRGTPGKLLLGCRLVDANSGSALRVGQAVLRNIAYLASMLPLCLGFLWIVWDKRKQGFHDKIAKTVVVLDDPAQTSLAELEKELR